MNTKGINKMKIIIDSDSLNTLSKTDNVYATLTESDEYSVLLEDCEYMELQEIIDNLLYIFLDTYKRAVQGECTIKIKEIPNLSNISELMKKYPELSNCKREF